MRRTTKRQPQRVCVCKESWFDSDQVEPFRQSDESVLCNNAPNLLYAFKLLAGVEGEFQPGQPPMQERDFSLCDSERNPCVTI